MIPRKKIIRLKNVNLLGTALNDSVIFTPFNGVKFIVQRVMVKLNARTGTITEARINLQAGGSTDIVASVIPVAGTAAVDTVKDHTVATGAPAVTYAAPLTLTTVAEATATVGKVDIFIEGLLI